jgi:hypothetical protein
METETTEIAQSEITESKHEKFLRLAKDRTITVKKALRVLGNCAGSGYEYSEKEAQDMLGAIADAYDKLRDKFQNPGGSQQSDDFQF